MMSNLKRILILVLLASTSLIAYAQKGTLKGVVTQANTKDPIPFLNVYTADKAVGTTTNFDGEYEMELEEGTHEVTFSSLEFGKTTKTVNITAGETSTLDVALSTADIKMETIIVKTDKYAKPIEDVISSMEIIKPNIIENKAAADMTEALEQAPGLTIVDNEPQLRGGSGYSFGAGSRVMILVDDMPLLTGDAGRPSWGFMPVENIEQVEIIKGASSVLYGSSALNGVINIRTAYPKSEPSTKINLMTGVYEAPKRDEAKWWQEDFPFYSGINFFHSRRVNKQFSFVVGGNLYTEKGFVGPPPTESEQKIADWNELVNSNQITSAQYVDSVQSLPSSDKPGKGEFTNRMRINFNTYYKVKKVKGLTLGLDGNIMYSRSSGALLWLNNTDGVLRAYPGALTTTLQTTFNFDPSVEYFDQRGNKHSLKTRVFHQNNDNDNNQKNKNTVFYGEYRYMKTFKKIPAFNISAGLMGTHTIGESQLFAGGQLDSLIATGGTAKRSATNAAIYAQIDKKMWDRVNFTAGGRLEYYNIEGETDIQPVFRAGASGRVLKATYIRTSFGQGFRFPTIAEKFIQTTVGGIPIIPNDTLKAERSWNFEVGIKQGVKIGKFLGYVDLAGFISQYKDYIEFLAAPWSTVQPQLDGIARFGFGFRSTNIGPTRVSGIDFSVMGQGNFTEDFGINLLAGYTWSKPVSLEPDSAFAVSYKLLQFNGDPETPVTYRSSSSDTTTNILKYRYEHLVKADIEANYKILSLGVSFRYYSFMRNVDRIFGNETLENVTGINAEKYRQANKHGEYVFDFRIAVRIASHSKISFIVNNAFNREYALRPLVMNPPRSYVLQYSLTL